ncbi:MULTISPECIES: hypothetical protein [unclassified Streptomyces]|uniref:hypothetical protein n=1 Tax=unclassified Streptomyces TaxID=2593676 RepID=UPI0003624012|nr:MULTISPECIES: hypothetical protein [unclassified Streptomyces]MYQ78985.1 hypothetical protein [Streptomyces sp. SID4923]
MSLRTRLTATLFALGVVATAIPLAASPATAASAHGCSYPYVCLFNGSYQSGTIWGRYKVPGYQSMPKAHWNTTDAVVNTLNDDSVWLLDTGPSPDRYICIPRNTSVNLGDYAHPNGGTWANDVDVINIWPPSDNGLCSGTTQVRQGSVPDGWRP